VTAEASNPSEFVDVWAMIGARVLALHRSERGRVRRRSALPPAGGRQPQEQFDFIQVFPSHRAHVASGTSDGVFVADPDCDGLMD
jgi:hypothetical protein